MALIEDDETLQAFKTESLEHLDGIESDLLAIEEAGADIDQELVNKVFRAMHSIKGGAGFLGLETVKNLGHAAENVLNKIRNGDLVPSPGVISSLLDAADILSQMIHKPESSAQVDIAPQLAALNATVEAGGGEGAGGAPTPAESAGNAAFTPDLPTLSCDFQKFKTLLTNCAMDISTAYQVGHNVFLLSFESFAEAEGQWIRPEAILHELQNTGQVLGVQSQQGPGRATDGERFPEAILFSTIMEKDLVVMCTGLNENLVFEILPEYILTGVESDGPLAGCSASPVAASPSTPPLSAATHPSAPSPPPAPPPEVGRKSAPPPSAGTPQAPVNDGSLRVNVRILDNLMTLAGELVLTRNQFLQLVHSSNRQAMDTVSQRLNLVTTELQEAIMSTRMQPVGNIFNKFKRVVRDLAQKLGKEIDLILDGGEVEMDKTIIEALTDPLTHLVRNSVDHGLERPEARAQAGKNPTGTLRLSAFHEGGQVIIEIFDDGAGIDTGRLKEKALQMGVHDRAQLEAMPENELLKLIFLPGLSTAKEVTDVSGRGVGMDVVHANLSKVGGVFDIASQIGKGTTITIKLPLTLAIIPSLIVSVEAERYAIPQVNLVELVRVPAAKVKERIERIGSALVMRLRGDLLPLIRLTDVLGIKERQFEDRAGRITKPCRRETVSDRRGVESEPAEERVTVEEKAEKVWEQKRQLPDRRLSPWSAYNILVVSAGSFHYGLIVDRLLDSEEIVVKPLGSHLRTSEVYAGATIQGDGRVALILDVVGISKMMKLATVSGQVRDKGQETVEEHDRDAQSLLIVRNSASEQLAIPLGLISRIEKIGNRQIETTGGRKNIQYRGGTLPLFQIDEVAAVSHLDEQASYCYVVVFSVGDREVGITVGEIVDIITVRIAIDDMTHKQPGILGSAIILNQITLLVDLFGVIATLMPDWVKSMNSVVPAVGPSQAILVVEDSKFFNKQLCEFVAEVGYRPFKAMDGVEALAVLAKEKIDLILTDIEMPNMDGLELTMRIRADKRWAHLPIIAVTSVAGDAAEKRGLKAGINEYMIKLDREKIIQNINRYLNRASD